MKEDTIIPPCHLVDLIIVCVNTQAWMCIPFFIPVPAGPHFPEFRIFCGISGFPPEHDEDGSPGWVYRRAASSARLVARLIAKIDLLSSSSSEGAASCERGLLCVVAVAESTYVGHAFSHELRM